MCAQIANPRKQFKYTVHIPGLNPFYCQRVTLPDEEFDASEHGESGGIISTAGISRPGMLHLENIQTADGPEIFIYAWVKLVKTGNPRVYKKSIMVEENGPDGFSVLNTHVYSGCWPQKVNGLELNSVSSDNTLQTIDFKVDQTDHR